GVAAIAVIGATWLGLLFSFSQSSFISLIVGVVVIAIFGWRRRAVVAAALVGAVFLVGGFSAPQAQRTAVAAAQSGLNRATSGRWQLIENGIRIALSHPAQGV